MARLTLVGRSGAPGVGLGRLLVVAANGGAPGGHGATGHGAANGRGAGTGGASAAASVADERRRLSEALERCAEELDALAMQTAQRAGEEVGAIFEAQALFARDPGITGPAFALIDDGLPADAAILRATAEQADALAAVDDDYFRERAADVRDVGRRVAAIVTDAPRPDLWHADGEPAILVAADLDPSAVATLRRELVGGIALGGGAPNGHAAIVARALGIPMVLGLGAQLGPLGVAGDDDALGLVDGTAGRLLIDPTADERSALEAGIGGAGGATVGVPGASGAAAPGAGTHGIAVVANVASALEAEAAARAGAEGIGLVRTELLFLGRSTPPGVAEQRATYRRILDAMPDRPVVFRTLDVGGDKPAEWQGDGGAEPNPALGVRGVRLGLRRTELLDAQFAALVGAAAGRDLWVMLPMVATVEEVVAARARLEGAVAAAAEGDDGGPPSSIRLGVMIEVPAAALMADALAEVADFFSIGTNDLVQYSLAADRTNPALADLASPLQPAVLRLIEMTVRAARGRGRHVAVCGEAAADPAVLRLLVGLGVEELSVSPGSVAVVRGALADVDLERSRDAAARALRAASLEDVRAIAAELAAG